MAISIAAIFASAHETRMEQATVQAALGTLERLGATRDVSIRDCQIVGGDVHEAE